MKPIRKMVLDQFVRQVWEQVGYRVYDKVCEQVWYQTSDWIESNTCGISNEAGLLEG